MLVRRAYETRNFIKSLSTIRMRAHFNLPLSGENEIVDQNIYETANKFFDCAAETSAVSHGNSNKFHEWLLENSEVRRDLEIYCQLSYWLTAKEDEKIEITQQYRSHFNKELKPLDIKDIKPLHDLYKKRHQREKREFRTSKAQLVDLSLKEVTLLLSWFPIFLIIGGYTYANIVYSRFDIVTDQFFLINDYLAVSLEQVNHVLIGAAAFLAGLVHAYWSSGTLTSYESGRRVRSGNTYESGKRVQPGNTYDRIATVICGWIFISHFYIVPSHSVIATVATVGIFHHLIFYWAAKYFKNGLSVGLALLFAFAFFVSIGFGAQERIREIKTNSYVEDFEIVSDSEVFSKSNSVFIGANSRFIFLKTAQGELKILRINQVNTMFFEKKN